VPLTKRCWRRWRPRRTEASDDAVCASLAIGAADRITVGIDLAHDTIAGDVPAIQFAILDSAAQAAARLFAKVLKVEYIPS
jgi:hypothetical protein